MYKVRKIRFIDHPVLKNMEFSFVGKDGKAVDNYLNPNKADVEDIEL